MDTDTKAVPTFGIVWESEPVQKRAGPNASDNVVWRTDAQIPVVVDLDAFRAEFGDAPVLASLDGTSIRVMAQDIARRRDRKTPVAELQALVINRIRGIRTRVSGAAATVTKYPLPGGTFYIGTDVTEYRQLYIAALVESGVSTDVALNIALTLSL